MYLNGNFAFHHSVPLTKSSSAGTFLLKFSLFRPTIPVREHRVSIMDNNENAVGRRAGEAASGFGLLIRSRRKAMRMRQDQLALATGVGRRFLIELEAGKPSCQLGRSLLVAQALGLRPADILGSSNDSRTTFEPHALADLPELPDLPEELE
jgi:DNA-binding XRE family transcriptional regulator